MKATPDASRLLMNVLRLMITHEWFGDVLRQELEALTRDRRQVSFPPPLPIHYPNGHHVYPLAPFAQKTSTPAPVKR